MRVIKSKDGFNKTQDMVGERKRCGYESELTIQPSRVKRRVRGTNQGTSNIFVVLGASYATVQRFATRDKQNYVYCVTLLQRAI